MHVYAVDYSIILDGVCERNIKYGFNSTCPSYEEINILYPSVQCDYIKKGFSCLNYYSQIEPDKDHIFINPPGPILERTKVIEIRANFEEYIHPLFNGYNKTDHALIYGVGRYVEKCHYAYIDSEQWIATLGDTLVYLKSNCTETNLITERVEQLEKMNHDITTSYKYILEQWIKLSLIRCKELCFEY